MTFHKAFLIFCYLNSAKTIVLQRDAVRMIKFAFAKNKMLSIATLYITRHVPQTYIEAILLEVKTSGGKGGQCVFFITNVSVLSRPSNNVISVAVGSRYVNKYCAAQVPSKYNINKKAPGIRRLFYEEEESSGESSTRLHDSQFVIEF